MIRSLAAAGEDVSVAADMLVIGAGIAGLLVAARLAGRGKRVVVIESGGEHQEADTHPLNEVVQLGALYAGASDGRFRCLGGTSTRWGGAMIPFLPADLQGSGWPLAYDAVAAYVPEVEALFGLPPTPYDAPEIAPMRDGTTAPFVPRLAKWPSFGKRNVAALLDGRLRRADGPEIWLEATATGFELGPNGRLDRVTAQAPNGRSLTVSATETVIAAGAIESTRLLLLLDRQHDERLFAPYDVLGRYFHDHLSALVGTIEPSNRTALNRVAGFRFEGGGMRNLRFEPSEAPAVRADLRPCFAHIAFRGEEGGGFDMLRDIYRRLQQRRLPDLAVLRPLLRASPWLARAAWWRWREHRLLYPADAQIELHMVIEQSPRRENRITLSPDRSDAHGQPLAAIDWTVAPADQEMLTRATDRFVEFWDGSALADLGTVARRPAGVAEAELADGGGVYHPGGSTRMGTDPGTGVLDGELRVFGVPNLSSASTAAFPTGGGANPTMMLMLAALRLADRLAPA